MIQKLTDNIILYHGSYCEVKIPDLELCAKYKDFGQGFYLTTSKEQARNFAKMSTRKAVISGTVSDSLKYGTISSYCVYSWSFWRYRHKIGRRCMYQFITP